MSRTLRDINKALLVAAKRLYQKNCLAACDGNLSYRVDDEIILITPKGKPKADLSTDEFALINMQGDTISGEPSSERSMHLRVYRCCPKARCVVHAHPPTAIAWTIACPELVELPSECMSELIVAAGRIPIAPYARPGTAAMGEHLEAFLPLHRIIILARHGALCWGESIQEASHAMERLEHSAEILMRAKLLGGLTYLPQKEVEALQDIRKTIGEKII